MYVVLYMYEVLNNFTNNFRTQFLIQNRFAASGEVL